MRLVSIASASYRGGATFSLLSTLVGLKNKGVDILVITPEDGFLCEELKKNGIPYLFSPIAFSVWPPLSKIFDVFKYIPRILKTIIINFRGYFRIEKIVSEWKPDIIHTNVSVIDIGYRIAKKYNIPHIWHIREYGDKDFDLQIYPNKKVFREKLNDSYSISITRDLKKYFNLGNKCKVIYNPIDFPSVILQNNYISNKIIFVGNIYKNKGVSFIIDAFAQVALKNNFILEFWGNCAKGFRNELENKIINLGLQSRIFIKGPTTTVPNIMQNSRAIIVASRCEGFGRITAEAMLNGCVVIGRNTGGTKEQMDNGLNICGREIALRFNSKEELSNAILKLWDINELEYNQLRMYGEEVAKKLYNVENNIEQTYNFMRTIILGWNK